MGLKEQQVEEIRQIDSLQIMYKTIFDVSDPEFYWTIDGDEHFDYMNKALIEWFKISGNIKEYEHLGSKSTWCTYGYVQYGLFIFTPKTLIE